MGAAAGHIKHLYEDSYTSTQILDIFNKIVSGKIPIYEKIDGQNLMVSFKDGIVVGARNKTQLRNPIDIRLISELQFSKYPHVKETFDIAIQNILSAFNRIPTQELNSIFCNGFKFLNLEIVNPNSPNVIHYGEAKNIMNSIDHVNNGNISSSDPISATEFYTEYKDIFDIYSIYPPVLINMVGKTLPFNISSRYTNIISDDMLAYMGFQFLKIIPSISSPKLTRESIKSKLVDVIKLAKTDNELNKKIIPHLHTLSYCNNHILHTIPVIEGIVFKYNNTTYKITGTFAPINQILGIIKYSR